MFIVDLDAVVTVEESPEQSEMRSSFRQSRLYGLLDRVEAGVKDEDREKLAALLKEAEIF